MTLKKFRRYYLVQPYLFGLCSEKLPGDLVLSPTTTHLEACKFVAKELTAQLCLRITQWLEGLASKALDLESKIRGSHVGTYLPSSGIWHNTQRHLKKIDSNLKTVKHLDFDAATRENALPLPDDRGRDDSEMKSMSSLTRAADSIADGDIIIVQIRRYKSGNS
ncbi:nuclear pore complex protein NUP107-like isoform X2 [Silene latifolia]|uniref:nuclear pore complex protein NUP107-like isoform X2 n=1 Tax=Silene latifolia TaxID=37657 RepID=UPI003D77534E